MNTIIETIGGEVGTPQEGVVDMRDIHLKYQDGLWVARIKVAGKWLSRSNGWVTRAQAEVGARALRDKLQAEVTPVVASILPVPAAKPAKTFRTVLLAKLEEHIHRQRLRNPDPHRRSAHYLLEGLGIHADDGVAEQQPRWFAKVRDFLVDDAKLKKGTRDLYARYMRELLKHLVPLGLNPACIAELENLPSSGVSESSGEPFSQEQLRIMMAHEPQQSELCRILFWIGASGGPQVVDAAFIDFAGIDFETGLCRWKRVKSRENIGFAALPPLLKLLKKRRSDLGEAAVYVLPEMVFSEVERKNPLCNTVHWDEVPVAVATAAAQRVTKVVTDFLKLCGIKAPGITNKSWRKHNISLWASLGIKEKTRMRMAGHTSLDQHSRYDTPADFEICHARDIMWKYYQAIAAGKPFDIPTTTFDVCEVLVGKLDRQATELKQENVELHLKIDGLMAAVERLVQAQTLMLA